MLELALRENVNPDQQAHETGFHSSKAEDMLFQIDSHILLVQKYGPRVCLSLALIVIEKVIWFLSIGVHTF